MLRIRLAGQKPSEELEQLTLALEGLQATYAGTFSASVTTHRRVQVELPLVPARSQDSGSVLPCPEQSLSVRAMTYLQDESQGRATAKAAKDLTLITFRSQPELMHMILRYA